MTASHRLAPLGPPQTRKERASFFLIVLFLVAYKCNDALSVPQFWAEDATVFFHDQFGQTLPQLFTPYAGYLHTIPRLVAWVASWLPVIKAPLIYNASAVLLSATAIALTCRQLGKYIPAWILAMSFLAVPTGGELFGTLTNTQWFLQFTLAAYCLAPVRPPATPLLGALRALGIFLIAVTGPFSVILSIVVAAMLAGSWLARRVRWEPFGGALANVVAAGDWRVWAALALGAAVQTCALITRPPTQSVAEHALLPTLKLTFTHFVPIHTFGGTFLTGTGWLLLYTLILGLLVFSRQADGRARLAVLGFAAFGVIATFAPIIRQQNLLPMLELSAADRYFYLVKVVWWWAVWLVLSGTSRRSRRNATVLTAALISIFAVTNSAYLRRGGLLDLSWPHHAHQLDAGGLHRIPVNPAGWSTTVGTNDPAPAPAP
jgi:hypothetical protein